MEFSGGRGALSATMMLEQGSWMEGGFQEARRRRPLDVRGGLRGRRGADRDSSGRGLRCRSEVGA